MRTSGASISFYRPLTLPPAAVPAQRGRPSPMALAPSLVRNVRCSKEARRALASEPSLVTWVSVTAVLPLVGDGRRAGGDTADKYAF